MPVRASIVGEFEALLANVRLALAVPVAVGVNVTVKLAEAPAAIVFGNVIPDNTNSPLLLEAPETVTDAPIAFNVPGRAEPEPTVTLPKSRVSGDTDS